MEPKKDADGVISLHDLLGMDSKPLFGGGFETSLPVAILKIKGSGVEGSAKKELTGELPQPFALRTLGTVIESNTYHSACLETHIDLTAGHGVGIIDEPATRAARALLEPNERRKMLPIIDDVATEQFYEWANPLTDHGFDVLLQLQTKGYFESGQGYALVERDGGRISRLDTLAPAEVWRWVEENEETGAQEMSFRYSQPDSSQLRLACFGDDSEDMDGEVLDLVRRTDRFDHYGEPMWLSALPSIELDRTSLQRVSDYWRNRSIPDHLVALGGSTLQPADIARLQQGLSVGRRRRGIAALLDLGASFRRDRNLFEIHKIGSAVDGNDFRSNHETVNLSVASSWRMPPVLAGITVTGRMGAANEIMNAIMLVQATKTDSVQGYIATRYNTTLMRDPSMPEGLRGRKLRCLTLGEHMDLKAMGVVARQREQAAESPDRDPQNGLERG